MSEIFVTVSTLLPNLSAAELGKIAVACAELMAGLPVKASRAKGVKPVQFEEFDSWVEICTADFRENGIETEWECKVAGEMVTMPASFHCADGVHRIKIDDEEPKDITSAQAKSYASWCKEQKTELYQAFKEAWDLEHPKEVAPPAVAAPVRRTMVEIRAAAAAKREKEEAEKAERARVRAEAKAIRDAEKARHAAEVAARKEARAAATAAKATAKTLKVISPPSEKAAALLAAMKAKMTGSGSSSPASVTVDETPAVAAAAAAAPAAAPAAEATKKTLSQKWTPPEHDGVFKIFLYKKATYMVNNQFHVYTKVGNEKGDWVGVYDRNSDTIDSSIEEPVEESDDEEFDDEESDNE